MTEVVLPMLLAFPAFGALVVVLKRGIDWWLDA